MKREKKFLKEQDVKQTKGFKVNMLSKLSKTSKTNDIHWNFTKFLVNKEGKVLARFEPTTSMKEVKKVVEENL